jgi:heme-degrading monooxygenase HmoA
MISRHWRGVARPEEAENYISHLKNDTFAKLATMKGFLGASVLRREVSGGTEFLVITNWESMEAITQFAGPAADLAVVPASVQAMMTEYDRTVAHYEVIVTAEDCHATSHGPGVVEKLRGTSLTP